MTQILLCQCFAVFWNPNISVLCAPFHLPFLSLLPAILHFLIQVHHSRLLLISCVSSIYPSSIFLLFWHISCTRCSRRKHKLPISKYFRKEEELGGETLLYKALQHFHFDLQSFLIYFPFLSLFCPTFVLNSRKKNKVYLEFSNQVEEHVNVIWGDTEPYVIDTIWPCLSRCSSRGIIYFLLRKW